MTILSTLAALLGLCIAIFLIIKKVHPFYSLVIGALAGGLAAACPLDGVVKNMIGGAGAMMPAVLRILCSGILAGALIKTGSAEKIARAIVTKMGRKGALPAIALSTMVISAVGVFVDIAVITVAPIALAVGLRLRLPKAAVLLAMIGGGKAGNIISPNPNTVATAEAFDLELIQLMWGNALPALLALGATLLLTALLSKRAKFVEEELAPVAAHSQVSLWAALAGPFLVIVLLSLRPLIGLHIDPLVAFPLGGALCALACGRLRELGSFSQFGLSKVIGVAVLMIGTGTLSGVIGASALKTDMIALMAWMNMPAFVLAPISGILLSGATASTTAGTTIASQTFAQTLVQSGIAPLRAATMVHAGATVLDSLPHGSFFHASAGAVFMHIPERMKLLPYEMGIGLVSTLTSVAVYLLQA